MAHPIGHGKSAMRRSKMLVTGRERKISEPSARWVRGCKYKVAITEELPGMVGLVESGTRRGGRVAGLLTLGFTTDHLKIRGDR
jgi:hypothetical protein